ncbi:8-oxo-dGTP diphosphatase [Roseospirillum parvum]|uniref:8-oxo-dGTP diphosphatase n=2 Tax=Roseospirillum parvum TaxID=83401 RepID=A0A1G7TWS6_9PROT|nr:8-oxo-dGTP diphosphatase [Roseospirillum parvum]
MPDLAAASGEGCARVYPLTTDRLTLERLTPAEAEAIRALVDDPAMVRFTANIPHPYAPETAVAWVEQTLARMAEGKELVLVARRRDHPQAPPVGCVGLLTERDPDDAAPRIEIGYWVARAHWGQGYAVEMARALIGHAVRDLGVGFVEARLMAENRASLTVVQRLGMTYLGPARVAAPARGTTIESLRYGLSAEAFLAAERARRPLVMVAAGALIDDDGRVLLCRRPPGKSMAGLWEFPGGKLDPGEPPEEALIRELAEELAIKVLPGCLAPIGFASHAYPTFHLMMPLFACRRWRGTLAPQEGQEIAWVRPQRLRDYPMPPADEPLIPALQDLLGA